MSRKLCRMAVALLVTVLVWPVFMAEAQEIVYDITKNPLLYGNLSQNDPLMGAIGPDACGPVAAVNSFVYLENAYPGVYDRMLVPDDNPPDGLHDPAEMAATALVLSGPNYMNTQSPPVGVVGTAHDDFLWGKHKYMEEVAPGRTRYEAWDNFNWVNPQRPKPDWVNIGGVDKMFLYEELVDCEDVEVLIIFDIPPNEWGHYVTVNEFHWVDGDGNGIMTFAENATMGFIDPFDGLHYTTQIWDDGGYGPYGAIETEAYGTFPRGHITVGVSESPAYVIPEPTGLIVFAFGALVAARRRRRN